MFYTYLWLREDGTPYYVGKGTRNRAYTNWAHGVHKPANTDLILLQEFPTEEDAFTAEKFLIAHYGRLDLGMGRLRNLTDGGENPPKTKKGRRITQAHRDKIRETLKCKGIKPPNQTGFHHTEEVRKKISASMAIVRSKETHGRLRH